MPFAWQCGVVDERGHAPGFQQPGAASQSGRFFSPTVWQRSTQSIRTAILENLCWHNSAGWRADGHSQSRERARKTWTDTQDLLVRPDRCRALPSAPTGSVDLARASDLYNRLTRSGSGFDRQLSGSRAPECAFELYTRFGQQRGSGAAKPSHRNLTGWLTEPGGAVCRAPCLLHPSSAMGYYYWDYQRMRRECGILEFGLDL